MTVDNAALALASITQEIQDNLSEIVTEEDAKIQIIIRVLTEVLGWSISDVRAERKNQSGFSDLILCVGENKACLVEAKRIGKIDLSSQDNKNLKHFKLSGPAMKNVQTGIEQAHSYAAPNGIILTVLTDGLCWIIFKSFIAEKDYKDQEAFVFPSLETISENLNIFYELLSKESYSKKIYVAHFDNLHNNRLLLSKNLKSPIEEYDIKPKLKSDMAFDLDQVFSAFFSKLKDEDLLVECFVETRESRIADFSLEKITASVLGNVVPPEKYVDAELNLLIQNTVQSDNGQTVFIVGPTGAGKTTFLDRFFKKTLSSALRKQCVLLHVDCLFSTGREDTVLKWLTETLIKSLEDKLYDGGSPSWDQLKGLYYNEYERRKKGVDAVLYRDDQNEFERQFGKHLSQKVEEDREGYLKRILTDVVSNRKNLPILLIDNTDEFSPEYKKEVFQFAQSLSKVINHCLLIFPVTDKSAWSFSKTDIYSIYKTKSFFLPTPPPREVFRKRIDFIRNKLKGLPSETARKDYMAKRGINISISNIERFASVIEDVFVNHEYTSKTIGELSKYNIRTTLELAQRVITSPVYDIEDLLKAMITGDINSLSFFKFMNALLKGDYELYKQNDNHFILPIYQVSDKIKQSPLLFLRILSFLLATKNGARTIEDKHVSIQSLHSYFDAMGCPEIALNEAVLKLLEAGLIEPYDASVKNIEQNQKLAITYSGIRHQHLAMNDNVFFEQMALTTAITNHGTAEQINSIYYSERDYQDKMKAIRDIFYRYLIEEDRSYIILPDNISQFDCQRDLNDQLRRFSSSEKIKEKKEITFEEIIKKETIATVDRYDFDKGYGFVDVEGESYQAFIHSNAMLKNNHVDRLFDGDKILCDIARNDKGYFVKEVHDFEPKHSKIECVKAKVARLFPDRRYGFVEVNGGSRSAFFHFSSIEKEVLASLVLGQDLEVEISPDKTGDGFQVRRLVTK